ncbi:MAG TPA: radical SAM family heme chaperone HemW, partial [Caulobacteraceae bacterium]
MTPGPARTRARPPPRPRLPDAEPLAVYVHWPYCARICPYCDFNVVRDRGRTEQQAMLAGAILADLQGHRALTGPRRLVSIYLGGGTPSLMPPEWAEAIIGMARDLWPTEGSVEVTLEANPTDAEAGRFAAFADAGVNRLSLGVQAIDDQALAFLGRNHTAKEGIRAAAIARTAFPRLSLDLIYARPGQTPWAWAAELETATALGAEHLSPYQLTIETGTAFGRAVGRGQWTPPDPDTAAAMYEVTQEVLSARGFEAYEVSNHASGEAARSQHNLAYWRGSDYVGVGPGAHGRLALDGVRTAVRAAARPADYIQAVRASDVGWAERESLSRRQVAEERLLTGLRTHEGVALAELLPLGLVPSHPALQALTDAALLRLDGGRL